VTACQARLLSGTLRSELIAGGLNFPTSLAIAPDGRTFVSESGLPFAGAPSGGRVWEIMAGDRRLIADGFGAPLNGLTWYDGALIVSEPGQILRLEMDGSRRVIIGDLPSGGNYHTNMAVASDDGWIYFSQGSMTNTGIVGLDAYELGWLRRLPHTHDVPGFDVVLSGIDVETPNPLSDDPGARVRTGAFVPFGTPAVAGERIPAALPCTAAVMRVRPDGSRLELVAWGLRNAFGLGFLPDGRLLAVDQGADDRGSRPLGNVPDFLFEIRTGTWYGWPDFVGGEPVTDARYTPHRGAPPRFLLANHHELPLPMTPIYRFASHVAATKFAVVPGAPGQTDIRLALALFGDEKPMTSPMGPKVGRSISVLDLASLTLRPLALDGLERPIDVAFHPIDGSLHVLDFGRFEMLEHGRIDARAGSGTLWRVTPEEASR
jgi:glucose/arabinose dehydrogenase